MGEGTDQTETSGAGSMRFPAMASINGGPPAPAEFQVDQAWIDASTMTASRPDMSWTFLDALGHFHAFDHDGKLHTVVSREEFISYENDDDEYEGDGGYTTIHLDCALCGEEIKPKYVPDNPHKTIPGRASYRLTIQADVPSARFSVVVTGPDQVWFGYGDGYSVHRHDHGVMVSEVPLGPMWWRPRTKVAA